MERVNGKGEWRGRGRGKGFFLLGNFALQSMEISIEKKRRTEHERKPCVGKVSR